MRPFKNLIGNIRKLKPAEFNYNNMLPKVDTLFNDKRAEPFLWAMLVFGIASGLFMGVFDNYLSDILKITKAERGIVEFPRELPGLLLVFIVALLYKICETRILRIAFFISLIGVSGQIFLGESRSTAIIMIILWSTGEHIMMPLRRSMSVHMAVPGKEGLAMGMTGSLGNIGMLIGNYIIPLVFLTVFLFTDRTDAGFSGYRTVFILASLVLAAGLLFVFRIPRQDHHIKRQKLYFNRKFIKYYILEMFFGTRKQVFITFAPFVLIKIYACGPEVIGLLRGFTATVNIFASPYIGKIIDRLGYRTVLIADTLLLTLVCLLYGFAHMMLPPNGAFGLIIMVFILDSVLFAAGMARTLYVKSISDSQEEVTSTLSTGISINHLISILIAIAGGYIWEWKGVEVLFSTAAVFAILSFIFTLTLPRPEAGSNQ